MFNNYTRTESKKLISKMLKESQPMSNKEHYLCVEELTRRFMDEQGYLSQDEVEQILDRKIISKPEFKEVKNNKILIICYYLMLAYFAYMFLMR